MSVEPQSATNSSDAIVAERVAPILIESTVRKSWGNGYVADFSLTNQGAIPTDEGYFEFRLDHDIKSLWGGNWDGGRTFKIPASDFPLGQTIVIGMTLYGSPDRQPNVEFLTGSEQLQDEIGLGPLSATEANDPKSEDLSVSVDGAVDTQWSNGFVYRATATNTGLGNTEATIIEVLFDGEIEKLWGATLIETFEGGFRFQLDAMSSGGTQNFGFVGKDGSASSIKLTVAAELGSVSDLSSPPIEEVSVEVADSDPLEVSQASGSEAVPEVVEAIAEAAPAGLSALVLTGSVRYDWTNGYVYDLVITNGSDTDIGAIDIDVDGVAGVNNVWNVDWDGGNSFSVPAGKLSAGQSVTVGLSISGDPNLAPSFSVETQGAPIEPNEHEQPTAVDGADDFAAVYTPDPELTAIVEVPLGTSATELQNMIDGASGTTTFVLQAGTYDFDRQINIATSDIAVIGAGASKTLINVDASLGASAFRIGQGQTEGEFHLAQTANEGATSITLQGDHTFEKGDYVYLLAENTDDWLGSIGDSAWRKDAELRRSMVKIEDVEGRTLTLESGIHFEFDKSITKVERINVVSDVRVGGMAVDYGLGQADPSDFSNPLDLYDRVSVVELDGTRDAVLYDLDLRDVPSHGVTVSNSVGLLAADLSISGAHNKGDGGNGYAVQLRESFEGTIVNLDDSDMRHSLLTASWRSAVDNTVHVRSTDRDINFHGGRDKGNVVLVDHSIRDQNSDIISPTVFVNSEGKSYGAPTDSDANSTTFSNVIGTRLEDTVRGSDLGSFLDGAERDDTLIGGQKADVLKGGSGNDDLQGGGGVDIALYDGKIADFDITVRSSGILVEDTHGDEGKDQLNGIEWMLFSDGAVRSDTLSVYDSSAIDGIFGGPGFVDPGSLLSQEETSRLGYRPSGQSAEDWVGPTPGDWTADDIRDWSQSGSFDILG